MPREDAQAVRRLSHVLTTELRRQRERARRVHASSRPGRRAAPASTPTPTGGSPSRRRATLRVQSWRSSSRCGRKGTRLPCFLHDATSSSIKDEGSYIEATSVVRDSLPIQMRNRDRQQSLPFPSGRGGHRPGAGRKPSPGRRPGVPHRARYTSRAILLTSHCALATRFAAFAPLASSREFVERSAQPRMRAFTSSTSRCSAITCT